jgi:hypothetical protein
MGINAPLRSRLGACYGFAEACPTRAFRGGEARFPLGLPPANTFSARDSLSFFWPSDQLFVRLPGFNLLSKV